MLTKIMENKKILVVEDEPTLQRTMTEYLINEGFQVVSAMDGEKAVELAKTEEPDLIVLDIVLPKKDGYAVLEEVKADEKTKSIPIILLTNLEGAEDIQKAFEKGATTYLVKSDYQLEDVARKIKETLKIV